MRNQGSFFYVAWISLSASLSLELHSVFAVLLFMLLLDSPPKRYSNPQFGSMHLSVKLLQSGKLFSDSFYYLTWGKTLRKDDSYFPFTLSYTISGTERQVLFLFSFGIIKTMCKHNICLGSSHLFFFFLSIECFLCCNIHYLFWGGYIEYLWYLALETVFIIYSLFSRGGKNYVMSDSIYVIHDILKKTKLQGKKNRSVIVGAADMGSD